MLPLDVPFVSDGEYPAFLAGRATALASVHFSLHDPHMADARQRMEHRNGKTIMAGLESLGSIPKYALMNARLHAPDKYFDPASLAGTARILDDLLENARLDGVIFADPYYLQALSDAHPSVAARLEAVPSVNAVLDSAGKVFAMLDMIDATGFRQPSRVVLDRSLNRDKDGLATVSARLRTACPDLKLHLIANEGCLYQCPYKPAHDAHVAMVNEGLCGERTFAMNHDFGCIRRLLTAPGAVLASPFIRPEDLGRYEPYVDGIKLCGRNKGTAFLMRTVSAYLDGKHEGNLLDLMDAMGDLSERMDIPNHRLPADFAEQVTACAKDCRSCGWCAARVDELGSRTDPGLTHL